MRHGSRWAAATILCLGTAGAYGQVQTPAPISNTAPTADFGFNLPTRVGTVTYSLTGSDIYTTGNGVASNNGATFSGNLAVLGASLNDPFSMIYSGGYIYNTNIAPNSETFQDLSLSQVIRVKRFVFVIADSVAYLPDSPTVGLSGIAGVGDVGVVPTQPGLGPGQSIFADYGKEVSNGLTASANYQLTGATTLDVSGAWQLLDFFGSQGYDLDTYSGSFGGTHRVDARNSFGAQAAYSRFTYPGYGISFDSESLMGNYSHIFSAAWSVNGSIGPERSVATGPAASPAQWTVAGGGSLNFAGKSVAANLNYNRGVNGGSGIVPGAVTDTVAGSISRPLGRDWDLASTVGWSRNRSLTGITTYHFSSDSLDASFQVSRRLSRTLSAYGSYTAIHQTTSNLVGAQTVFTGTYSVVGAGITFSPAPLYGGR